MSAHKVPKPVLLLRRTDRSRQWRRVCLQRSLVRRGRRQAWCRNDCGRLLYDDLLCGNFLSHSCVRFNVSILSLGFWFVVLVVQPVSSPIPNKAAIVADLRFAVFISLLLKWLLSYFLMQRYGDKTNRTLLWGSKRIIQKLNYIFSQKLNVNAKKIAPMTDEHWSK